MKSILLGNPDTVKTVYPESIIEILIKEAGLNPEVFCADDIRNADLSDTRFIFSTWSMPYIPAETIKEVFPALEGVFYSAGSVQGFAEPFLNNNVKVFSAWMANAVPVAEYTLAQILLANKNFFPSSRLFSNGLYDESAAFSRRAIGNYEVTVGIIGAGAIGKLVINFLKSHNIDIIVFDPFLSDEKAVELGVKKVSLDYLFTKAHTISNHLANNPQTKGMLNYDLFKLMDRDAVFINTGRGAQVVERDLCRILSERPDITALLDVTFPEPPEDGHMFFQLPNAVLTPHIAGSLGHEIRRMPLYMLEEFRRYINNKECKYQVDIKMLATMA